MKPIQRGWRSSELEASATMSRETLAPRSTPSDKVLSGKLEGRQNARVDQIGLDAKRGTNEGQGTNWGLGTKRGTEVRFLRVLTGA